jgi:lantibiotic leader peptide-processing serine protease
VIAAGGGHLVYSYDDIGVAVASSSSALFRDQLMRDARVEGASATTRFASRLDRGKLDAGSTAAVTAGTPAPGSDALSSLQWDMDLILAPAAIVGAPPGGTAATVTPGHG